MAPFYFSSREKGQVHMRNNSVAFPLFGMAGSTFIPVFHFLYGEGITRYVAMILYTLVIVMDWIGGYRASKIDGSYASEYGIAGGFRTAFLLLMPAVGHLIDVILSMPGVAFGFLTVAFGQHIWKSMTANVIRAGWDKWVPEWAMVRVSDELDHKVARARERIKRKTDMLNDEDKGA
ncbi:toxin secretion/phage lysis holin [Aneurinibacillus aneurinilyticus ATCC 12856]|uniref:Toxin secretion/phage lysis holin n=2 Tax=Aneurinibacillus aneurinilyticus TaxID=1391 RepID=U1X8H8_ANEAE|nr:toxin secretion/phage lysis holin [Aneurinibacillus aneurinilyticus ATCC 12856]